MPAHNQGDIPRPPSPAMEPSDTTETRDQGTPHKGDTSPLPPREEQSKSFSGEFTNVYHLARVASELGVEWPVPEEAIAPFREASEFIHVNKVRNEFLKVLRSPVPSRFFKVLRATDDLACHFEPVWYLIGATTEPERCLDGDAWDHTMRVIDRARVADLDCKPGEIMAALGMYFNMAYMARNPPFSGYSPIDDLCGKLGLRYVAAMYNVSDFRDDLHNFYNLNAESMLELWRAAGNSLSIGVEGFARVCQADAQGSCGTLDLNPYPQRKAFLDMVNAIRATDLSSVRPDKDKMREARIESIKNFIRRGVD